MSSDTDIADVVARAFELFAQGNLSLFSPDYTHLGYNIDGRPMVFEGLGAFLEMMAKIPGTFEVFENNIVSTQTAGDELVLAAMQVRRRTHDGKEFDGALAMTFRVENGILTRGCDMVTSEGEAYWSSLGL